MKKSGERGICLPAFDLLSQASRPGFLLNQPPCWFTCLRLRCLASNRPQKPFKSQFCFSPSNFYLCSRFWLFVNLRRERDLNPRYPSGYTRLPIVHLRPLGHLSQKTFRILTSFGAGGIRTPGTLTSSMVFETISFNRSDTAPVKANYTIHQGDL